MAPGSGITRGKTLVMLLGQKKALTIAVKGKQVERRWVELERAPGCLEQTVNKSGASPEETYRDHAQTGDPATDVLLNALHGLFDQVSERNHELVELNKTLKASECAPISTLL